MLMNGQLPFKMYISWKICGKPKVRVFKQYVFYQSLKKPNFAILMLNKYNPSYHKRYLEILDWYRIYIML